VSKRIPNNRKNPLPVRGGFDLAAAEYICACMADGYSMANVFRQVKHIHPFTGEEVPNVPKDIRTHYRWARDFPKYNEMIMQAKEDRADTYVEMMLDVVDQVTNNTMTVSQGRFKVDTIKWIACKFKPRSYSDEAVRNVGKTSEALQVQFNFILNDQDNSNKVKQIEADISTSEQILIDDAAEADLIFKT